MRGTIIDDGGVPHRVSGIWVSDDAGAVHEVVRAWVGDPQGVPHVWFDRDVQLSLAVTPTVLDANSVRLNWVLQPQGEVAEEYHVYRGGVLRTITTSTTYTDTGLSPGTTYTWRIDVVQAGSLTVSGTATATTSTFIPPPTATLTATAAAWDKVNLSWTVSGQDSFTVKRGSTVLATSGTSFTDTLLSPSTAYTYTLTAVKAGATSTVVSKSATTPAHPDLGLTATATAWNTIDLSWSAKNGSVDEFELLRGSTVILTGSTATSKSDTGLAENTGYSYTLRALRSNAVITTDTASATTPVRPLSSGSVAGDATSSSTGWTGATRHDLTGRGFAFPVGGTMTNVNGVFYGHVVNGRIAPLIGGVERQHTIVAPGRKANDAAVSVGFAAGTHSVGIRCGGTSPAPIGDWGQTEWSPPAGVAWNYNVCIHRVDYTYYASLKAVEEMRNTPWWREELAEAVEHRSLHIVTSNDEEGNYTSAVITDKESGQELVNWKREG